MMPMDNNKNSQQSSSSKFNPDFKHWLSAFDDKPDSLGLVEAVNDLVLQAQSTLELLEFQFADSNEARAADDIIFWSLRSAINSIKDIDAIVNAYHEAQEQVAGGAA
jgi:hypothetical protein